MSQMSQLTQSTASSSEELAATAEEMTAQAGNLQQLMRFFAIQDQHRAPGAAAPSVPAAPLAMASRGVPPQVKRAETARIPNEAKFDRF